MLTRERAKAALWAIMDSLRQADHNEEIREAIDHAGNDLLRRMQFVFPVYTQIEMEVIRRYGFSSDGDGLIKFAQEIAALEREDGEIRVLNDELRQLFLPKLPTPVPNSYF